MANNNKQPLIVVAVVLWLLLGVSGAEDGGGGGGAPGGGGGGASVLEAAASVGGNGPMSCMGKLEPCQKFLMEPSSEPSPECCTPMKEVVTKEVTCLCNLFHNAVLLQTVNITQDNALAIAKKCGSDADPSICKNVALSPLASSAAESNSTPTSGSSSESGTSDARNVASPSGVFLVLLSFLGLVM